MPRTRQGGNRSGTPGQNYPNRSDIQQQPSLPARAAPGQTYGKATQQLQAQRMVPLAPPRLVLPQPVAPPTGPAGAGPGAPPGAAPIPAMQPGDLDLHRPSERPNEPVTAGAPIGPGPGPEAIPANSPTGAVSNHLSAMLAQIAQQTNNPAIHALAAAAQGAGQ